MAAKISGRETPLFLIDLGMPRNIAHECSALLGVYVYDLDQLKGVVENSMARKADAKQEAEAIVARAVDECIFQLEKARAHRLVAQKALA